MVTMENFHFPVLNLIHKLFEMNISFLQDAENKRKMETIPHRRRKKRAKKSQNTNP